MQPPSNEEEEELPLNEELPSNEEELPSNEEELPSKEKELPSKEKELPSNKKELPSSKKELPSNKEEEGAIVTLSGEPTPVSAESRRGCSWCERSLESGLGS